jgi:hypothetical protein
MVLDPLQTKVSACGQGQICDSGDGMRERFSEDTSDGPSVGAVLFVMRNGKRGAHRLDNLANGRADTEVGSI